MNLNAAAAAAATFLVSFSRGTAGGGAGRQETGHKNRIRRRRAWRSVKVCVCVTSPARCHVFFVCFFLHFFIFILDDLPLKTRRLGHLLHSACGATPWHFHQQQQGFIVVLMRGHSELRQLETPNLWTKMRF